MGRINGVLGDQVAMTLFHSDIYPYTLVHVDILRIFALAMEWLI